MNKDNRNEKLRNVEKFFYRNFTHNIWCRIAFGDIKESSNVLEIGSGSGLGQQNALYPSCNLVGIDLDERVLENPYLKRAFVGSAYSLTEFLEDEQFDVIYSHMVAEHIEFPEAFIAEQLKVLKPGGRLVHSTVSKWYWTSILNIFLPEKIKYWLVKNLGSGRTAQDIFPAFYQLNSAKQIKRVCENLSCSFEIIRQDQLPGYLRRSYLLMIIYLCIHKSLINIVPALKPTFIFVIKKN